MPAVDDCVRGESGQREDGSPRAAFHADNFDLLKFNRSSHRYRQEIQK